MSDTSIKTSYENYNNALNIFTKDLREYIVKNKLIQRKPKLTQNEIFDIFDIPYYIKLTTGIDISFDFIDNDPLPTDLDLEICDNYANGVHNDVSKLLSEITEKNVIIDYCERFNGVMSFSIQYED